MYNVVLSIFIFIFRGNHRFIFHNKGIHNKPSFQWSPALSEDNNLILGTCHKVREGGSIFYFFQILRCAPSDSAFGAAVLTYGPPSFDIWPAS